MPHAKSLLGYLSICTLLLLFCGACTSVKQETRNPKVLSGYAENLWSERIDLGDFSDGVTIINPFSPSLCGYCLIDGEFIKANYFRRNQERGGDNLFLSPFSPQLDNYTFVKHYREEENTTLAFPPSLRDYHPNGYPWLTIFHDGQLIYGNVLSPYDGVFDSLKQILWPEDNDITMRLTTPTKLSDNLIYESATPRHVSVVANGEETIFERLTRSNENRTGFTVKHEKDLTPDDFAGNVSYIGKGRTFGYDMLKEREFPCKLDSTGFQMGSYVFPFSEFGFRAIMPNPYSPENYLILNLSANDVGARCNQWADFTVSRFDSILQKPAIVLDGFFDKSDPAAWKFADSLTTTFADLKALCPGGVCPVPSIPSEAKKPGDLDVHFSGWLETDLGRTAEFGNNNCRFPSNAAGTEGQIATVWEEDGDIIMALTKNDETPTFVSIERELSDSFDPCVVWDGEGYLVVYLNDKSGHYRVYGRYYSDGRTSSNFPISELGSFDAITPVIASNGDGRTAVAWSEWKANYRWPKYRTIENRVLGEIEDIHIRETGTNDYVNAWYASILYDGSGQLQGAWNQHYPTSLGVCAGNLTSEATLVTGEAYGGYPSLIEDNDGQLWTFWESALLGMYRTNAPQQIQFATQMAGSETWTIPMPISVDSQTTVNQTPSTCVDQQGVIHVVWSGRQVDESSQWHIYLASYTDGEWTYPVKISGSAGSHRAPDICCADDGSIWITCHSGAGEEMKISLYQR